MDELTKGLEVFLSARRTAWSELADCEVGHQTFGNGRIVRFEERGNDPALVVIRFGSQEDEKKFKVDDFFRRFWIVKLSDSVRRSQEEWASARAALEEGRATFSRYAAEYDVPLERLFGLDGPTELGVLLTKVQDKNELSERELAVLRTSRCLPALQRHFRNQSEQWLAAYQRSLDEWDLVRACKCLRDADAPNEALEISAGTLDLPRSDPRARAALLTSRGGAYRDLGELENARKSAAMALQLEEKSYFAETLLGAICFMEENYDDGVAHFDRAVKYGAKPRDQDEEIRRVLRAVRAPTKKELVAYLLKKDPARFEWARRI